MPVPKSVKARICISTLLLTHKGGVARVTCRMIQFWAHAAGQRVLDGPRTRAPGPPPAPRSVFSGINPAHLHTGRASYVHTRQIDNPRPPTTARARPPRAPHQPHVHGPSAPALSTPCAPHSSASNSDFLTYTQTYREWHARMHTGALTPRSNRTHVLACRVTMAPLVPPPCLKRKPAGGVACALPPLLVVLLLLLLHAPAKASSAANVAPPAGAHTCVCCQHPVTLPHSSRRVCSHRALCFCHLNVAAVA